MSRDRITVVIADDHPMFREGLARAIKERPDLELLGEATDGREAVALVDELQPDVAVFDVRMPGLDGGEVLAGLRARNCPSKVIFLSAYVSGELVHEVVSNGAMGFLSKEAGRQEICEAVVRIAAGEMLVDPRVEPDLLRTIQRQSSDADGPPLTKRELEVLRLAADGLSTVRIAETLQLSPETIKSHMKALFAKLDVTSRTAAVAEALRRGLLD